MSWDGDMGWGDEESTTADHLKDDGRVEGWKGGITASELRIVKH